MQGFRVRIFALSIVILIALFPIFLSIVRRTMLFSPESTPANIPANENQEQTDEGHRNVKVNRKGCSLDRKFPCYAQCCEDHWIYERYFANPPFCNGTYVEIGAYDGVTYSNTKFFEDALEWNGVLIEGYPPNFKKLERNRPKSNKKHSAVCKEGVETVKFTADKQLITADVAYLTNVLVKKFNMKVNNTIEVPCKPMGKLLREAGISKIDFFSLDIEGAEMVALETMDWMIPVKVFLIETYWIDKKALTEYLRGKGYKPVNRTGGCYWNTVFERDDIL